MATINFKPLVPGLLVTGIGTVLAHAIHAVADAVSPLIAAVALGVVVANIGPSSPRLSAGIVFAAKRLMRAGVVLLGLQLSFRELAKLGGGGILIVAITVAMTFFGTQWAGKRLGVSPGLSLLVATGYSICGASAIAAMKSVSGSDDDEVTYALALVTICGSLAVVVLPGLGHVLGLSNVGFGNWAGAAVHDVGQVVATAAPYGNSAVKAAVVVKLTRVVLLAPMVFGVSMTQRSQPSSSNRPAAVPLFVIGFLGAIALRSTNVLSSDALASAKQLQVVLLSAALFALGCGVKVAQLRKVGGRPLVLGMVSWLVVSVVALAASRLLTA